MKLNLTKEYVIDSNYVFENGHMICGYFEARDIGQEFMGEEIEPEIAIKDLQNFQDDWLAMYAELEVRTELIEKLKKEISRLNKINEVLNCTIQDVY